VLCGGKGICVVAAAPAASAGTSASTGTSGALEGAQAVEAAAAAAAAAAAVSAAAAVKNMLCICEEGYWGASCTGSCPASATGGIICSGHGGCGEPANSTNRTCCTDSGLCLCDDGFVGVACSWPEGQFMALGLLLGFAVLMVLCGGRMVWNFLRHGSRGGLYKERWKQMKFSATLQPMKVRRGSSKWMGLGKTRVKAEGVTINPLHETQQMNKAPSMNRMSMNKKSSKASGRESKEIEMKVKR